MPILFLTFIFFKPVYVNCIFLEQNQKKVASNYKAISMCDTVKISKMKKNPVWLYYLY